MVVSPAGYWQPSLPGEGHNTWLSPTQGRKGGQCLQEDAGKRFIAEQEAGGWSSGFGVGALCSEWEKHLPEGTAGCRVVPSIPGASVAIGTCLED